MEHDLIQSWLELPPGSWPPDHYTLLGLEPGENETARVEQHVHERMQRLRTYQLTHPELATEAMNRLAQALVCLTDPEAKKAYDQERLSKQLLGLSAAQAASEGTAGEPAASSAPASASMGGSLSSPNGASEPSAPFALDLKFFDWQTTPPPLRQPADGPLPPLDAESKETTENAVLPGLGLVDTIPDSPPLGMPESEAPPTPEAVLAKLSRRRMRSKGALYYQIARTRQLLWAWEQVGKYLNRPTRLVGRPAEATDLIHHMGVIRELLPSSTPLLGQAGQPGYLVLALARQQMIVPTLQTLLPSQREALARDWQAGYAALRSVRQFLRQEIHVARSRHGWRHAVRLVSAGLRDHPGLVLLVLAWVAINLANPLVLARWPEQLICLLALIGVKLAFWLYSLQPIRIPRGPGPEAKTRLPSKRPRARGQPNSSGA
jgi:hypothetical protein